MTDSKGHVWKTEEELGHFYIYHEGDIACYEHTDKDGFGGPHAGPVCKNCEYTFCIHCHPSGPTDSCEP